MICHKNALQMIFNKNAIINNLKKDESSLSLLRWLEGEKNIE